jgi:hypothetical protein
MNELCLYKKILALNILKRRLHNDINTTIAGAYKKIER